MSYASPAAIANAATANMKEDEFTPTLGQVSFILSEAPGDLESLKFIVNGIEYDRDVDYNISGVTITWLDVPFTMETDDKVIVRYL